MVVMQILGSLSKPLLGTDTTTHWIQHFRGYCFPKQKEPLKYWLGKEGQ